MCCNKCGRVMDTREEQVGRMITTYGKCVCGYERVMRDILITCSPEPANVSICEHVSPMGNSVVIEEYPTEQIPQGSVVGNLADLLGGAQ